MIIDLYCYIKVSKVKPLFHGRTQHSKAFQTPLLIQMFITIRDWNVLPDSLISSPEVAEDCVAKFTSLVRARD